MDKLSKIAKGLDTFFKILLRIWAVGMIIGVFGILLAGYLALGGWNLFEETGATMLKNLHFGMLTLNLAPDYQITEGVGLTYTIVLLIVGVLAIPVFYLMIRFIRNILKPMMEKEPFHETLAVNLKRLAWIVIAHGVLGEIYEFINYRFILKNVDLKSLFINEKISSITLNHTIQIDFIVFAVVLFLLSHVFKYGQELQQLSDETL